MKKGIIINAVWVITAVILLWHTPAGYASQKSHDVSQIDCSAYIENNEDFKFFWAEKVAEAVSVGDKKRKKEKIKECRECLKRAIETELSFENKNFAISLLFRCASELNDLQQAQQLYTQLKFLVTNPTDPQLVEIGRQLKSLRKKAKFIKYREVFEENDKDKSEKKDAVESEKPKDPQLQVLLTIIVIAVVMIGLVIFFFALPHETWSDEFFKTEGVKITNKIVDSQQLISLDRMRSQDGRVSRKTMDKILERYDDDELGAEIICKMEPKKDEKPKQGNRFSRTIMDLLIGSDSKPTPNIRDDPEELQKKYERPATAWLIIQGYEMIERVNDLAPYPVAILSKMPRFKLLPQFWQDSIFGLCAVLVWMASSSFAGLPDDIKLADEMVRFCLIFALITSGLTCLRIMARTTINSLDEIVSMLEPPPIGLSDQKKNKSGKTNEQKKKNNQAADNKTRDPIRTIEKCIYYLFRSRWQLFVIIFFAIVIAVRLVMVNDISEVPFYYLIQYAFYLVLVFICAPIIWMMIGSIHVLNRICSMEDLSVNPLSPLKTMGLEKWASVIGTFGVSGSLVLSFGCSIPVIKDLMSGDALSNDRWFWFMIIMPFLFFYWIYPYCKISGLVREKKTQRMQQVKIKILNLFKNWIEFEEEKFEEVLERQENNNEHLSQDIYNHYDFMKDRLKTYLEPMENYYGLFTKIDKSPLCYINFSSMLELGKALGIPSAFAVLSALLL